MVTGGMLGLSICTSTLLLTVHVRTGDAVYCKLVDNEYYIEQAGICKKCDPCPSGWGKAPVEDIDFEISSEHGATDCLKCIPCTPGVTFSRSISHRECRQCKDCSAIGKAEKIACTTTKNTKCMKIMPTRAAPEPPKEISTEKIPQSKELGESPQPGHTDTIIILGCITGILSVVLVLIVLIILYFKCKKQQRPDQNVEGYRPVNGEESSGSSGSEFSTKSTDLDEDGDSKANVEMNKQVKEPARVRYTSETIAEKLKGEANQKDFRMLSTPLGAKSVFEKLGTYLDIEQNEIDIIKDTYKDDPKEQAYRTLEIWKQKKGKEATKQVLYNALQTIGRQDIADNFLKAQIDEQKEISIS